MKEGYNIMERPRREHKDEIKEGTKKNNFGTKGNVGTLTPD